MLKKLKNFVGIAIGSTFGVYLGNVIWLWLDFCRNPGLYELASAPWYAGLIPISVIAGILLLIETALYFYLRYRIKASEKTAEI